MTVGCQSGGEQVVICPAESVAFSGGDVRASAWAKAGSPGLQAGRGSPIGPFDFQVRGCSAHGKPRTVSAGEGWLRIQTEGAPGRVTRNNHRSILARGQPAPSGLRRQAIPDFAKIDTASRGWRACVHHDVERPVLHIRWCGSCCASPDICARHRLNGSNLRDVVRGSWARRTQNQRRFAPPFTAPLGITRGYASDPASRRSRHR